MDTSLRYLLNLSTFLVFNSYTSILVNLSTQRTNTSPEEEHPIPQKTPKVPNGLHGGLHAAARRKLLAHDVGESKSGILH